MRGCRDGEQVGATCSLVTAERGRTGRRGRSMGTRSIDVTPPLIRGLPLVRGSLTATEISFIFILLVAVQPGTPAHSNLLEPDSLGESKFPAVPEAGNS